MRSFRGWRAVARRRRGGPAVVELTLLETAANGPDLNPGQAQLVRELAGSRARVQLALIGSRAHSRGCPRRTSTRDTVRAGPRSSTPILAGVRVGLVCGRLDRSTSPASPSAAQRVIQVRTHLREMAIAAAMCACAQPARCRATISLRP